MKQSEFKAFKIKSLSFFFIFFYGAGSVSFAENQALPAQSAMLSANGSTAAKTLPKESEDQSIKAIVDQAFSNAQSERLPLSPAQVNEFQKNMDNFSQAIHPGPPPKMVSRTQNVSLDPGTGPVMVRLSPGYASSLIVVDATGEPWPITTVTVGNKKWFSVVKPNNGSNNMLTVNALKDHVSSNILITLQGKDSPIVAQLSIDSDNSASAKSQEADMVVSMRVNIPGPKASPPILGASIGSSTDSNLISFLDGVPAPGANLALLKDAPDGVIAWRLKGNLYLRTPYPARSPAWTQQIRSSSGINVYVMPETMPEIILAVNGESKIIQVAQ